KADAGGDAISRSSTRKWKHRTDPPRGRRPRANARPAGSRAATSTPRGPNESGGKDAGGEIAVATIADDGHDDRILDLRGDAQGHMQRATGRNAGEDAFFLCQPSRHLLRCSLTDRLDAVDPGTVE